MKISEGDLSRILKGFKASGDPYYFFWRALKERFVMAGSNQTKFADQLGVDQSYLSRVLSGVKIAAHKTQTKIADALETTISNLQREGEILAAADEKPGGAALQLVAKRPPGPDKGRDNTGPIDWEEYRGPAPKALEYVALDEGGYRLVGESPLRFDPMWLRGMGNPEKMAAYIVEDESMEPVVYKGDTVVIDTGVTKYVDGAIYVMEFLGNGFILRYKSRNDEDDRPVLVNANGRAIMKGVARKAEFGLPVQGLKGIFLSDKNDEIFNVVGRVVLTVSCLA